MLNKIILTTILLISAFIVEVATVNAEYGDIIMNTKKDSLAAANMKPVLFSHWFHRIRFKCKVCHEDIFIMAKDANDVNMNKIMSGESCGKCHNGIIAWEPLYCERCHSYEPPQARGAK